MNEDVKEAIDQFRYHHQLYPDRIKYEPEFNAELIERLNKTYGHNVFADPAKYAVISAVTRDANGKLYANTDFRKMGSVDGE